MEKSENWENNISLLMEKSGCTKEQAVSVLESTGGNLEQAISIINSISSKNIYIIKGRFNCKTEELYGLFLILVNNSTKELEKLEVVVSRNALLCQGDININWDEFEKNINSISIRKSELSNRKMAKLHHDIIDLFNSEEKIPIFEALTASEIDRVKGLLSVHIGKSLGDPNIELALNIDQIAGLEKVPKETEILAPQILKEKEEKEEEKKARINLQIALVLSPVSGSLVTELKPDDRVAVKVIDTTETGKYLAQLMGAIRNEEIIPIMAHIDSITPLEMDKVRVVVKFGPGVVGETLVSKNAKVKITAGKPIINKKRDFLSRITPPAIKERIASPLPLRPIDLAILLMIILLLIIIITKL
jgi:hypothetical protein